MALVNVGQYVVGQTPIIPVTLVSNTTGSPLTGVTAGDLQLSYAYIDGTASTDTFSVLPSGWVEVGGLLPGVYRLEIPFSVITDFGKLVVRVKTNTSEAYEALVEMVSANNNLIVGKLFEMGADIARLAGLGLENAVQDEQEYDEWGNLIAARLRTYQTRWEAENPDGSEPPIPLETYHFSAEFSGPNICNGFKMLRGEPPT